MSQKNRRPEEQFSALHDLDESETLETAGSVTEYDESVVRDEDCEANISEIFNETIAKIQSSERGLKRKYERLQEMKDEVLEGRKELEAKIQAFDDDKAKMRKMNENLESVVTVNVGGVHYSTSRSTLSADENSMLAAMFSGFHKVETLKDGSYFIDANGKHFGIILDFLRGRIIYSDDLPPDKEILHELRREVDFYNLLGLKDLIDVSLKCFQTRFSEWFYRYFQLRAQYRGIPVYESKKYISFRKFNGCNCKFKNAIFAHRANFDSANLIGATFDNCKFYQDISFKGASLVNAKFHDCEFANDIKITFDEANLCRCKFSCSRYGSKDQYEFNIERIRSDYRHISMISFVQCIEKMSFCNAKNIDQAHFPEVKLELIEKIFRT